MPIEDIELGPYDSTIDTQLVDHDHNFVEERVNTSFGPVAVGIEGDRKKPAIITFHDLGMNANSCFQSFFQFSEMSPIAERFCVYHINAPGQEEDATPLAENYEYPCLEDLPQIIVSVVEQFNLRSFIGFGVGIGANILCRYAVKYPKLVDGLILINCMTAPCGWIEWAYQKMNISYLKGRGMTTFTLDYLMWHHFGRNLDNYNPDLVNCYRQYFSKLSNPGNLARFLEVSIKRHAIDISREGPHKITCPVLQIVGGGSPYVNDTVDLNSKLDPKHDSNWMKISSCSGLVLEERPEKAAEATLLFLQGLGYFPSFSHLKFLEKRRSSLEGYEEPLEPLYNSDNSPIRRPTPPPMAPQPRVVAT